MEDYREQVERLARERTGESFYNNSPDHASIIIETLLGSAQREVCLLTHALNPDVFAREEIVGAAQKFLSDGTHSLKILIESDPSETVSTGHPLAQELVQHSNSEIRMLPAWILSDIPYHFTVADADSFRFEPNKDKWEASAAFGDERSGRKLQNVFDRLWQISTESAFSVATVDASA